MKISISLITCFLISVFCLHLYKETHKEAIKQKAVIEQTVIVNECQHDHTTYMKNIDGVMKIDTPEFATAARMREIFIQHAENVFKSPYQLETTYKGYCVTDYGTPKEIDSIKVIRYAEMKAIIKLDSIVDNRKKNN